MIIAFVSKERLLMKKKTARSEFERGIRADDDVLLSCHFALKISMFPSVGLSKESRAQKRNNLSSDSFLSSRKRVPRERNTNTTTQPREHFATGREKKKESRFEIINLSADDDHSIFPHQIISLRERKTSKLTISSGDKTPN